MNEYRLKWKKGNSTTFTTLISLKKSKELTQEIHKDITKELGQKTLHISEWKEDLEKYIIKDFLKLNKNRLDL